MFIGDTHYRISDEEQPEEVQELYPAKTIVCCRLWADGINGSYHLKNEAVEIVTVSCDLYSATITENIPHFLSRELLYNSLNKENFFYLSIHILLICSLPKSVVLHIYYIQFFKIFNT